MCSLVAAAVFFAACCTDAVGVSPRTTRASVPLHAASASGRTAKARNAPPHQYFRSVGSYFVKRTSLYESSGIPSTQRVIECFMKRRSSRSG